MLKGKKQIGSRTTKKRKAPRIKTVQKKIKIIHTKTK
jgi:hypothetical protein